MEILLVLRIFVLTAFVRVVRTSLCLCTYESVRVQETDYFTESGEFRVDSGGSKTLLNCLMYKMSYYRFGEVQVR